MALHDAAIKDEYFVKRKLAPNVDFWYVLLPTFLSQACSYPILGGKLIVALRVERGGMVLNMTLVGYSGLIYRAMGEWATIGDNVGR